MVWSVYYAIHIAQSDNNQVFPALLLAQVNAFEIKRHVTLKKVNDFICCYFERSSFISDAN